jgi:RNA polymerase sigma-70 factor, ECF subfamily
MDYRNRYDGIEGYAVRIIRYKAKQLVGSSGFNESDIEDLEQVMMLDVLCRLPKYDSKKAKLSTFVSRILQHCIATIIVERQLYKRDLEQCSLSLNDLVKQTDGGIAERINAYDIEEYLKRTGRLSRTFEDRLDISIDLEIVIASLPQELRTLCESLKSENVAEISRDSGIPRVTIYNRIKKLRKLLEDSGLSDYL